MPLSGCETSSLQDTSRPESLTSDQSSMSNPTTCAATPSATFSVASVGGPTPSGSPAGPMLDLFGQAVAPANPLAKPAPSVAATMSATYGLRSSASSASVALAECLASRLPALLGSHGSTMFALTWKAQATPQRRQICALLARARRTSDSGSTGWRVPTLTARDARTVAGGRDRKRRLKSGSSLLNMLYRLGIKTGRLHPVIAGWLMGYRPTWVQCAPAATRSSRKSQQPL